MTRLLIEESARCLDTACELRQESGADKRLSAAEVAKRDGLNDGVATIEL
jgi:hypothetical protein